MQILKLHLIHFDSSIAFARDYFVAGVYAYIKVFQFRRFSYFSTSGIIIRYNVYNEQHTRAGRIIQPLTKYSTLELVEIYHL